MPLRQRGEELGVELSNEDDANAVTASAKAKRETEELLGLLRMQEGLPARVEELVRH